MTNLFLSRTVGWRPLFGYVALLSILLTHLVAQAANQQLRIQVLDIDGAPVPLIHVTLGGSSVLQTDVKGECVYDIPSGRYVVALDATELANRHFLSSPAETVVIGDRAETARFILEPMVPNVKVSGRMVDDEGNALDPTSVDIIFFAKGSNDSVAGKWKDSEYSVNLYRGSWTVQILVRNAGSGLLPPTTLLEVCDDVTVTNFNLVARRLNRIIEGTIVDAKGNPVPAAFVQGTGLVGNSSYRASVLSNVRGEFAMTVCDGDWFIKGFGFTRYTPVSVSGSSVSNVVVSAVAPVSNPGNTNSAVTNAVLQGLFVDEVGHPVGLLSGSLAPPTDFAGQLFQAAADGTFVATGPAGAWTLNVEIPLPDATPIQQRMTLSLSEGTNEIKILVPQRVHWITLHPTNSFGPLPPVLNALATSGDQTTSYTTTSIESLTGDLRVPVFDGVWTLSVGVDDPGHIWILPPRREITVHGQDLVFDLPVCMSPRPWDVELTTVDEAGHRRPNQGASWSTERTDSASTPTLPSLFLGSSDFMHVSSGLRDFKKLPRRSINLPPTPSTTPEPTPSRYCGIEYGPARLHPTLAVFLPPSSGSTNLVAVEKRADLLLSGWITNLTGSSSATLSLVAHSESGITNYESHATIDTNGYYRMRVFPGEWTLHLTGNPTNVPSPRHKETVFVEQPVSVSDEGAMAHLMIPSNPATQLFPTAFTIVNNTENPAILIQLTVADSRDRVTTIDLVVQKQESVLLQLPAGKALISLRREDSPSTLAMSQVLSVEPSGGPNGLTLVVPATVARWTGLILNPNSHSICAPVTLQAVMKRDDITYTTKTTADTSGAFALNLTPGDWLLSADALSLEQVGYRLLHRVEVRVEKGESVAEAGLVADPMPTDYLASEFVSRGRPDGSTVLDLWHSYLGTTQVERTDDLLKWQPLLPSGWENNTLPATGEASQFYRARRQLIPPLFESP